MRLWRLIKSRYAADAFSGEGARLHGGRWNSPGTRVAYASSDAALAVLEVLVHLETASVLPSYSLVMATLPDALIEIAEESALPAGWRASPPDPAAQAFGDAWVRSARSVALCVPSAIVRGGSNVLLNPDHPEFARFVVESVEPFEMDPRLH
jgi:RES domain-containing protein